MTPLGPASSRPTQLSPPARSGGQAAKAKRWMMTVCHGSFGASESPRVHRDNYSPLYFPTQPPNLSFSAFDSIVPPLSGRAAMSQFKNPFKRAQQENDSGQITVHVKWGRDRFNIPIPNPSLTPLSQLIGTLSHQTGVPASQLKLIYKGAVLKDPSLTISSYGITDGADLALVGKEGKGPEPPAPKPQQVVKKKNVQPETDQEDVLTSWIRNLVNGVVEPLEPAIATFVSFTNPKATNRPKQVPPFETLQREHARLSELLLRGLLDLDGVNIPSEWKNARQERKDGVKRLQGELNKVDDSWGERKRLVA